MKRIVNIKTVLNWRMILVLMAGIVLGALLFSGGGTSKEDHDHAQHSEEASATIYTCSMHPQIRQDKPGLCPICAMDLIPLVEDEGEHDADPNEIALSASAAKLAEIQTSIISEQELAGELILQGKVELNETLQKELTARFAGRIQKLWVNFTGQQVQKGQKLAEIYSPELITAQKELLDATRYKESNPALYKAARQKLSFWDLTNEQIDEVLSTKKPIEFFEVVAPVSGTVINKQVNEGNYIKEGQALFSIADLNSVWIKLEAYENDLPQIHLNDEVVVTLEALPGTAINAKINFIDPVMNPQTRITDVRVSVENVDGQLKTGLFAEGRIKQKGTNGLMVPRTAVLWTGKRSLVYKKVPDRDRPTFVAHEISLGPAIGDNYKVVDGLSAGDEVVTYGAFKVDAAAQLAGKKSMMNPKAEAMTGGHHQDIMTGHETHMEQKEATETIQFPVNGACGMCQTRIEQTALGIDGVRNASWDAEARVLILGYNGKEAVLDKVKQAIAAAGHDNDAYNADNKTYAELPGCCHYRDLDEPVAIQSWVVAGSCGMCKDRIEKAALSVTGVSFASWDQSTQKLVVAFNSVQTGKADILKVIAKAGHDNEAFKADDAVYNDLPGCCHYERLK